MLATSIKITWNKTRTFGRRQPAIAAVVDTVLAPEDVELDYIDAKLGLDVLIDDTIDVVTTRSSIEQLVEAARHMAGPAASPNVRFAALRALLYDPGPWNEHRPYAYDHADPLGQKIANKLLANYLATRRGNCISMPILLLILGERLDLDMTLAKAPLHFLARYRDETGRTVNIEATSGGHPARDAWYRETMPMSDRAVENGLYLRSLSRRENAAAMATTVLEHLLESGRYDEALAVSEVILRHAPHDAFTMVKHGTACEALLREEFETKYPIPALIPPPLRHRYLMLAARNHRMFAAAEALGWEPAE